MRRTILCGLIGLAGLGCGPGTPTTAVPPPPGQPPAPGRPVTPAPPGSPADFTQAKKWTPAELATAKADLKTTATDWRKLVAADPTKAGEQYAGKVIELDGVVSSLTDPHGEGVCLLLATDEKFKPVMVFTKERQLWEKVGVGSKVVVRGGPYALQKFINPELVPAVLVSGDPNPAATVTAVDLAKETAADAEAAEKKYEKKHLFVTGEFVEFRPGKEGRGELILKGSGGVEVRVDCDKPDVKAAQALKAGTKVKAYGEVYPSSARGDDKAYAGVSGGMFKAE